MKPKHNSSNPDRIAKAVRASFGWTISSEISIHIVLDANFVAISALLISVVKFVPSPIASVMTPLSIQSASTIRRSIKGRIVLMPTLALPVTILPRMISYS